MEGTVHLIVPSSCVSGPLVAALVNVIGTKRVILIGAVLAFLGFLLSAFPPSLYFMYFSYGILAGLYDILIS